MQETTFTTRPAPEELASGWSRRRKLGVLALLIACSWAGLAGLVWAALALAELEGRAGPLRYLLF